MAEAKTFMDEALIEAQAAAARGEVPVGAVLVFDNAIIARSGNAVTNPKDPTGHAEIRVLRQAAEILQTERLLTCDLYVTLEPCTMCAGAISLSRIRRLYYGAPDEKGGAVDNGVQFFDQPTCHHKPDVYSGFQEEACREILQDFFKQRR